MTDHDIEQQLSRYRPRSPAPVLRTRALASGVPRHVPLAAIDWALLAAVATLALVAFWPRSTTGGRDPLAAEHRDRLSEIAVSLGGDAQADRLAVIVLGAQSFPVENQTATEQEQR
jgi:hypothetical protein